MVATTSTLLRSKSHVTITTVYTPRTSARDPVRFTKPPACAWMRVPDARQLLW